MQSPKNPVERDRYTTNLVAESISRILSFFGGLISTILLWRSISWGLWTSDDYGIVKILTNANQALLPLILLGMNGALVRVAAEYTSDRERLGKAVGLSLLVTTVAYLALIFITISMGLEMILLSSALEQGQRLEDLQMYWAIVLLSLLPTAYTRITKALFSGIQRTRRNLYVDIIYNALRIALLVILFALNLLAIFSIMLMTLVISLIAAVLALIQLVWEMRNNDIPLGLGLDWNVLRNVGSLSLVSLIGALVSANLNNVTVLWMNAYGTLQDVGYFSIAQGITLTARMILAAPIAAMAPNLSSEVALGRYGEVERKFKDASRMIVPTYSFAFAVLFSFAGPALRVLYGADSLGATGFLQLLSFNIVFIVIPGIYFNLYLALGNLRAMIYHSISQLVIQTTWIVATAPILGINSIASVWVMYVPYLVVQHAYTQKKHRIGMNPRVLISGIGLGLIFSVIMLIVVGYVDQILRLLPIWTIIRTALLCLLALPFWYLYMATAVLLKVIEPREIENMKDVLKVIPLAWYISRPLIVRLSRLIPEEDDTIAEARNTRS